MASLVPSQPWLRVSKRGAVDPRNFSCKTITCAVVVDKKSYGAVSVQGTGRPSMEDTLTISLDTTGSQPSFFGVFDGHGGNAVAEMLKTSLWPEYKRLLSEEANLEKATTKAYLQVDAMTLAQPKGFFGALKERGVGGSRCGATAATAVILPPKEGKQLLVAANVGDARVVISRGGQAVQLTVDHKPDVEAERKRIEAKNPTPKKPLVFSVPTARKAHAHSKFQVVKVGETWRIGGLLALSRAFGDAYLKDWSDGKPEGAFGGFGLTAEPDISVQELSPDDKVIILATDGLWERLGVQEAVDFCLQATETNMSAEEVTQKLVKLAQERGSTDDIAAIIAFL